MTRPFSSIVVQASARAFYHFGYGVYGFRPAG